MDPHCYKIFLERERKLQPYSNKINYPPRVNTNESIPVGYQPKIPNPGGLDISAYNYPYQNPNGVVDMLPGRGWREYEQTGKY